MTIDFSNPDFPVISLIMSKEMLRQIVADPFDGYLQIRRQKIVEAIEGCKNELKKFEALEYVKSEFKN